MQFITSGNRIAVENFVLGDLYTITFTNGTYINSACIGIGDNFVTFQRNEPELLFSLTMATAELVSSIELYAGGSGTNNYNDLSNKPQIGGVELVGNKSLSDLGIQATISDIDTIRSGAAAGATAVQPAALADYQPIISDLDTIRAGAAAGATAVQPADMTSALAAKQDALSSAQLAAVNSGITSTDVEQIETNKNNILSLTTNTVAKGNRYVANQAKTYTLDGSYTYLITVISYNVAGMFLALKYNNETTPRLFPVYKAANFDNSFTVASVADSSDISITPTSSNIWFISNIATL